ncbi:hypothetical protein [Sphingomonas hengshuiensis]|uniref:Uncharacterized protein n=1 Tax=Sphingomonas hengshuiensis TaxID=1609977 RepID=A0A7U4J668_9SPHN|nr:hypothetical protein [Sphingomonas hengshuiensis]AJP70981.1 hypothetical protein TS85_02790 [Sphingomonas hengshuiensis]
MSRGPDAATLLVRALAASAARAGVPVVVTLADSTRWASATFTGGRHRVSLAGPAGAALDAWLAALPGSDVPLRGHLIADLVVGAAQDGAIPIEALTVEER